MPKRSDRLRSLLYTWVAESPGLLLAIASMESGSIHGGTLEDRAVAAGTSGSSSSLGSRLMDLYADSDDNNQFLAAAAVSNLVYYALSRDPNVTPSQELLSLVTRNTIVVCRGFIDEPQLHEFLRITQNAIRYIPGDHPYRLPALCYWAVRDLTRRYYRWETSRLSPFPRTSDYIAAINQIVRAHGFTKEAFAVNAVLKMWTSQPPANDVEQSVYNTVEHHVLWHRVCSGVLE